MSARCDLPAGASLVDFRSEVDRRQQCCFALRQLARPGRAGSPGRAAWGECRLSCDGGRKACVAGAGEAVVFVLGALVGVSMVLLKGTAS